jgi:hypothetical protein
MPYSVLIILATVGWLTAWIIAFPCLLAWFLVLSGSNRSIFLIPTHSDNGLESISDLSTPYGAYGHVQ